jgi:hypothetical protein
MNALRRYASLRRRGKIGRLRRPASAVLRRFNMDEARLTALRHEHNTASGSTPHADATSCRRIALGWGGWWATLEPGQHQWPLRIVRREQWMAAAMARSA